mgnify:CR=1 FL=1
MRVGIAGKIAFLTIFVVLVAATSVTLLHHETTEDILIGQELGRLHGELRLEELRISRAVERLGDEVRYLARDTEIQKIHDFT